MKTLAYFLAGLAAGRFLVSAGFNPLPFLALLLLGALPDNQVARFVCCLAVVSLAGISAGAAGYFLHKKYSGTSTFLAGLGVIPVLATLHLLPMREALPLLAIFMLAWLMGELAFCPKKGRLTA